MAGAATTSSSSSSSSASGNAGAGSPSTGQQSTSGPSAEVKAGPDSTKGDLAQSVSTPRTTEEGRKTKGELNKFAAAENGAKQLAEAERMKLAAETAGEQEAKKALKDAKRLETNAYSNLAKVDFQTAANIVNTESQKQQDENIKAALNIDPKLYEKAKTKNVINSIAPVKVKSQAQESAPSLEKINISDETKEKLADRRARDSRNAAAEMGVTPIQQGADKKASGANNLDSDEIMNAPNNKPKMPADIERAYVGVNGKYYNAKTNAEAFEDKGNKLQTRSSNQDIASSLVKIAESRGWDEIKVSGTEAFRKAAWIEAASRGMQVKGYTPNEQDKVALEARLKGSPANTVENTKVREADKPASKNEERAQSFQNDSKSDALKKHPELSTAYAAQAAINKKMEQDGLSEAQKAYAQKIVDKRIAEAIQKGEIPNVQKREEVVVKKDFEKKNVRELSR